VTLPDYPVAADSGSKEENSHVNPEAFTYPEQSGSFSLTTPLSPVGEAKSAAAGAGNGSGPGGGSGSGNGNGNANGNGNGGVTYVQETVTLRTGSGNGGGSSGQGSGGQGASGQGALPPSDKGTEKYYNEHYTFQKPPAGTHYDASQTGLQNAVRASAIATPKDRKYHDTQYNCQGMAYAMKNYLNAAGFQNVTLFAVRSYDKNGNEIPDTGHAMNLVNLPNGKTVIVDPQTKKVSPEFTRVAGLGSTGLPDEAHTWLRDVMVANYFKEKQAAAVAMTRSSEERLGVWDDANLQQQDGQRRDLRRLNNMDDLRALIDYASRNPDLAALKADLEKQYEALRQGGTPPNS
jgi:hypothetical protein